MRNCEGTERGKRSAIGKLASLTPFSQVDFLGNRVAFSGGRVDFSGGRVDFSGNRLDFSGGRVDFPGKQARLFGW